MGAVEASEAVEAAAQEAVEGAEAVAAAEGVGVVVVDLRRRDIPAFGGKGSSVMLCLGVSLGFTRTGDGWMIPTVFLPSGASAGFSRSFDSRQS